MILWLLAQTADPPPARRDDCPVTATEEESGEIIVCARPADPERYRLRPLPDRYGPDGSATLRLPGGARAEARAEQGRLGDPRIMLHLRVPF